MKRHLVKTMALLTLVLAIVFVSIAPELKVAASTERSSTIKTTESIDQAELNRRGLSLGSTSKTSGQVVTTTIVQQDAQNAGRYVVTTYITDYGSNTTQPQQQVNPQPQTNNNYYNNYNNKYYSSSDLQRFAREDFLDTDIKYVAKKHRGKVSWRMIETNYNGQYAIARLTVRNRRGRRKVYWQYTDAVGTLFTKKNLSRLYDGRRYYYYNGNNNGNYTIDINEIDVSDIKDFLRD